MKILKNYIFNEWFSLFLFSLVVVSFILMIGNVIKLVELVVAKGVQANDVFKLFVYLLPALLVFSIPISILTATLLGFGRMASDNEITTMRSSGISLYAIVFDLALVGVLFSLLCLFFNDSIIPRTHYETRNMIKSIGIKKPTTYLEEKTFIKAFKNYIVFIYKIRDNYLEDVRIYQPQQDKPTRTIIAKRGQFIVIPEKEAINLELKYGIADEPSFDDPNLFYKINFKTYNITLALKEKNEREKLYKKTQDMTIKELKREIEIMKLQNIDITPLKVGLYEKFSLAFSSLSFIIIGIPLAIRVKRRERSFGYGISLFVCLVYYLIMAMGEAMALRNKIDPALGVWLANIILMGLGIILIFKVIEE